MDLSVSMILLWMSLLLYSSCIVPQIITNYRIKSAQGISDIFIWCYFSGYLFMLLYIFCQPFALPYRIMVPFESCLMGIVVIQRYYYDGFRNSFGFSAGLAVSIIISALALLFVPTHSQFVADVAGWVCFTIFTLNPIPQLWKIIKSKTTYGFSFWFITLTTLAQLSELIGGIIQKVPAPTLGMAIRGLIIYVFYVYLFAKYPAKR
jgi:uncharacterized protein with PQ loop repeat